MQGDIQVIYVSTTAKAIVLAVQAMEEFRLDLERAREKLAEFERLAKRSEEDCDCLAVWQFERLLQPPAKPLSISDRPEQQASTYG